MKPIFSRNSDHIKNAFINWRIEVDQPILNILNLAEGYLSAAIELAELCLSNNNDKRADILIFPIFTNANHGIELYLKAFNWMLNILLKSEKRIEGSHNIQQMFATLRSKVKRFKGCFSIAEFDILMSDLQNYILELYGKINATAKDCKMDFSRYPFNNSYQNHFYAVGIENYEIDLANFVFRIKKFKDSFRTISDWLYYEELDQGTFGTNMH